MTRKLLLAATPVVFAAVAYASSTQTGWLHVSAAVPATCVVSTYPVVFGTYAGGTQLATGSVNVQCNVNLPYAIALDAGQNYGETWRRVSNGDGTFIKYGLFRPTGGEWGDTEYSATYPYGSSVAGTASGLLQTHAISAKIFGGTAMLPAGMYTDVVNVSVYY